MGRSRTAKLSDEHRLYITQQLACYATPKEVVDGLKAEYGIEVAPQSVEYYDPTKRAGASLAAKWRAVFEATRSAFLQHVEQYVPEAHKSVRIRKYARAARVMEARGNYIGMADMLERLAKELGNVYTNRRELTGRDGRPIQVEDVSQMTDAQLEAEWRALMGSTQPQETQH